MTEKKKDIILKREHACEEKKKTNLSSSFPTSTSQIFYHYHGFKNRTGPAGSTGSTGDRRPIRFGSLKKPKN